MPSGRDACIVGVGETEYRRWGGIDDRSEFQLAAQAIRSAAEDGGVPLAALDGFSVYAEQDLNAAILQLALGMRHLRVSTCAWGGRGGGPCAALAAAAAAVAAGQAEYVVVFRSICQGQTRRYGKFLPGRTHANFTAPFGLLSPAGMMALVLQRYRHQYGLEPEQLAAVALSCRDNAQRNPRAIMHGRELTPDLYMASRMIAEPLRLFDCCLESDGACAVIVASRERARDGRHKPVEIVAATSGNSPAYSTGAMGAHNMPEDVYTTGNQRELAQDLFARAGVSPGDVDVAQIYDHFTGMVILALEDFGFCERGAGARFAGEGQLAWPDGRLPLNTSGGSLSEAYLHGMNHIAEGVRQIRGQSTSQVDGARLCLVTGGSGIGPSSAALLGT